MAWATRWTRLIEISRGTCIREELSACRSKNHTRGAHFHARPDPTPPRLRWNRKIPVGAVTIVSLSLVGIATLEKPTILNPTSANENTSLGSMPTLALLRSYAVWTVLGIPSLVDRSTAILDSLLHSSIPGLPSFTEAIVRATFFAQFIPGETAIDCGPVMESLRERNIGSALNYCAEADTEEQTGLEDMETVRFREVERALDVQGGLEQRMYLKGWTRGSSAFALKITGLIDAGVLRRASTTLHRVRAQHNTDSEGTVPYPGCPSSADALVLKPSSTDLSVFNQYHKVVPNMGVGYADHGLQSGDLEQLNLLWERLDSLSERARRNGVRLIMDAEESYYEPAIDGYVRLLSMKYNRPYTPDNHREKVSSPWNGPVIYGSYQCYLQRQPLFLAAAINDAEVNSYALGLKVVRGGYIVKEHALWEESDRPGTGSVWPTKLQTDASYNGSIDTILQTLKRQLGSDAPEKALSVIFGTHNIDSLNRIFHHLEEGSLAVKTAAGKLKVRDDVTGKIGIAQLYGMRSDLSDRIYNTFEESKAPMSLIFIAYGRLRETLPFLGRRAIENKSLMSGDGGAAVERRRVGAEIRRRFGLQIT